MLLHSTFQQLHSNITCASLVLYCCFTQLHINFTSTSLLLYMHFTVAYKLHHMHLNFTAASQQNHMHFVCTSLLPHSTLEQLHLYFTVVSLALHSSTTCISLVASLNMTTTSHVLFVCSWHRRDMYIVSRLIPVCQATDNFHCDLHERATIWNLGWWECFNKTLTCITHTQTTKG